MSYEDFADRYLNIKSVSGREAMAICLFHDDHNASMQYNLDSGLFTCFSCGVGGSNKTIERKLGVTFQDTGVGLDVIYRRLNELRKNAGQDDGPRLIPEDRLKQFEIPTDRWYGRGFDDATIAAFDLGYDLVRDALTIPVRTTQGDLMGVVRRFCDPDADPRYKYPKGFHKSHHLFASWMVANDPSATSVVLTEGAIDAMTVWQWGIPAMAVLGSSVSDEQIRILHMLGITEIILFFDNDRAGTDLTKRCSGWRKTSIRNTVIWRREKEHDLRRYFKVRNVDWRNIPRGYAKDANDLELKSVRHTGIRMLRNAPLL